MAPDRLVVRHAQRAVEEALADTRVVVVLGARQVGKSTLLEQVAAAENTGRELLTLDHQPTRAAAQADPAGFVAALQTPVAIDEIQRVPELMTEIKVRVDRDKSPGQFAVTGSANLLEMKQVKESLAGRAEYCACIRSARARSPAGARRSSPSSPPDGSQPSAMRRWAATPMPIC